MYNYLERATTYDKLVSQCRNTDLLIMNLNNALKGTPMSRSTPHASSSTAGFVDPNAMEVDATWMDKHFVNVPDYKTGQAIWNKALKGRCKGCGSKQHIDSKIHAAQECKHCGKLGHWNTVCLQRLTGQAPRRSVAATVIAPPIPVASTSSIVDVTDAPATATVSATTTPAVPPRPADNDKKLDLLVGMLTSMEKRLGSVEQSLN